MAIIPVTVAEVRAAAGPFPINDPPDVYVLTDTGANIATLTGAEVGGLAGLNISSIDATDDSLVLSIPQFISLGTVTLTASDVVTFQGSQGALEGGNEGDVATLGPANIDFIDSTDDALT